MAYNEQLANRVRELIAERISAEVEEKLMFGGVSFMVRDKIAVGVKSDRILVRIAPEIFDAEALGEGCIPMIHGGREMKGFLFVTDDVLGTRGKLKRWVDLAMDYNERAAAEQPKKKKAAPAKKKAAPVKKKATPAKRSRH